MRRWLKGTVWTVGVIVAGSVAAVAWLAVMGPRFQQAHALSLLRQDHRPTSGRNAWPALWLAEYDVPPDRIDAVYAQDRARMPAWLAHRRADTSATSDEQSVIAAGFAPLPAFDSRDRAVICGVREADCLAKVSAQPEAVQAVLARQQARLHRAESFDGYDYLWSDLPADISEPIPNYIGWNELRLSAAALDFAEGRREQGLTRVCTSAATARRLHGGGNTLIGTMVMGGWLQADARLFAHMLSELPPEQVLPTVCGTAFAPVELADVDLCPSMRRHFQSEFGALVGVLDQTAEQRKLISLDGMRRMSAPTMAWGCTVVVQRQLLADQRFKPDAMPQSRPALYDRITNPVGSVLVRIADPDYIQYLYRQQDTAASLRMVATVLWLRQTRGDGRPLAERLAQRPAWMQVAADRDLGLSADGRALHMGNHNTKPAWPTNWPLPVDL